MADNTFFGRLRRLFSTQTVVRNVGGKNLRVVDTDRSQAYKGATNFLTDRYTRLHSGNPNQYGYNQTQQFMAQRMSLFSDYEEMDNDPIIASALDVYADESTMKNEFDQVLKITSDDANVKKILHNLFYDILNVEFNLWPWCRNMVKYGDFFLKLDIAENVGIVGVTPISPYELERLEDPEASTEVKFSMMAQGYNNTPDELKAYEVAHFRLLSDSNYLPYGKAMIENARKTWKALSLMEDAMLVHRIMRAPEKRIFQIDIGNIPPNEVDNYMQQIINKMKKTPLVDPKTGEYNLKYNLQNVTEDFYLPVRGGDSGTSIDTVAGLTFDAVEDIEYLRNKMMSALKIPKAFLGYEEQVNAKATLAAEDVRFARTVERIQRILVSELTKIGIVHLYSQGFTDESLVNFSLELTKSSTIYEQEKIELWDAKTSLANSMIQDKLASSEWVYQNIFNMNEEEMDRMRWGVINDQKRQFRYEQISMEGNDPIKSGLSFGTPHDLATVAQESGNAEGGEQAPQEDVGGAPEGGFDGAGRPKEISKYGKDGSARGRDPLGKKGMRHEELQKTLKNLGLKKQTDKELIKETLETESEYNNYINGEKTDKEK
tara:strand:+ start:446 stop:2251 length:1806 start_codon:yes stop_codon:yes gene_type:complete